jgi:Tfp pilus assembly protein PilV
VTGPIQRLREEEGFGLVELMISLIVLNVGILAIVAAFNGGSLALLRSSETTTAAMLADKQAELYRAMTYGAISLNNTAVDGTYTGDTLAYTLPPGGVRVTHVGACPAPVAVACIPTQTITAAASPDGRPYRIDTYIIRYIPVPTNTVPPPPSGREVKRVTVVVRRPSPLKVLARVNANFDSSTG